MLEKTGAEPLALPALTRSVSDLTRAEQFYRSVLDFVVVNRWSRDDAAFGRLLGIADVAAQGVVLGLSDSRVELVCYRPAGRTGTAAVANDARFQHAAIVVSDMDAAWKQVSRAGGVAISVGGPQLLAGGLLAWKFRDPDLHPLELLQFGPGQGRTKWHGVDAPLFQGVDHSALTVRDTDASLRFYCDLLGLEVSSRSLNQGMPQQALDGVAAPVVRVTQVRPLDDDSLRIELLNYLAPAVVNWHVAGAARDVVKDRLVLRVRGIETLFERLVGAGVEVVSPGLVEIDGGVSVLVRDPDGHDLLLTG